MPHQLLERSTVALLRLADQHRVVYAVSLASHEAPSGEVLGPTVIAFPAPPCIRVGTFANRNWNYARVGRHVVRYPQQTADRQYLFLACVVMDVAQPRP